MSCLSGETSGGGFLFHPVCRHGGCHDPAAKRIRHPDGERVVCESHVDGDEVIEEVRQQP